MPPSGPLPGARWFARVVALDLECPGCAQVYQCGPGRNRTEVYDRRTGIFRCPSCKRCTLISLVGTPVSSAPVHHPADDWIPTRTQALQLRNTINPSRYADDAPRASRAPRNQRTIACPCLGLWTGALIVHPDCPVHAAANFTAGPRPDLG